MPKSLKALTFSLEVCAWFVLQPLSTQQQRRQLSAGEDNGGVAWHAGSVEDYPFAKLTKQILVEKFSFRELSTATNKATEGKFHIR